MAEDQTEGENAGPKGPKILYQFSDDGIAFSGDDDFMACRHPDWLGALEAERQQHRRPYRMRSINSVGAVLRLPQCDVGIDRTLIAV